MSTALFADSAVSAQIALWLRDLGAVRRLAPRTVEAYQRDLGQFLQFLSPHVGGPVSLTMLGELRAADMRAFLASRREAGIEARSLARALSAIKSFFRFLEREGVVEVRQSSQITHARDYVAVPQKAALEERRAGAVRLVRFLGLSEEIPDWRRNFDLRKVPSLPQPCGFGSATPPIGVPSASSSATSLRAGPNHRTT